MQALIITIFGITFWYDIFMGFNVNEFHGFFIDPGKLNPMKTNCCPKKFCKSLPLLFTVLNFNESGCKQCNENDGPYFVTFYTPHMKSVKNYSQE